MEVAAPAIGRQDKWPPSSRLEEVLGRSGLSSKEVASVESSETSIARGIGHPLLAIVEPHGK